MLAEQQRRRGCALKAGNLYEIKGGKRQDRSELGI